MSDNYEIIDKFTEDDLDKYLITDKYYESYTTSKNMIFLFDTNKYIYNNFKSYKFTSLLVYKQLILDIPRLKLIIFNKHISNILEFRKILTDYSKNKFILNNISYPLLDVVALLSTQSSFAFPCIFLNKLNKFSDNFHIIGLNNNIISISKLNRDLVLNIKSSFAILDSNKDITKYININLLITLKDLDNCYIPLSNSIFTISFI